MATRPCSWSVAADTGSASQSICLTARRQRLAEARGRAAVGRQAELRVRHDEARVAAATIRSQPSASEKPAPAAAPSTAAMIGFG